MPFLHLLGKPPIMVADKTSTTFKDVFISSVLRAGYHIKLVGGGHYSTATLRDQFAEIQTGCQLVLVLLSMHFTSTSACLGINSRFGIGSGSRACLSRDYVLLRAFRAQKRPSRLWMRCAQLGLGALFSSLVWSMEINRSQALLRSTWILWLFCSGLVDAWEDFTQPIL